MKQAAFLMAATFALLAATGIVEASPDPENTEVIIVPAGDKFLRWDGQMGRTYFIQASDPNAPLKEWLWMPVVESGTGVEITHEILTTADKAFFRLWITDNQPPGGTTLEDWDADGDGRTNSAEVAGSPQSNPLLFSSSATGIPDGWATAHGLDPNDSTIGLLQFQSSGSTNIQAYQAGVQADPAATLEDLDGDGLKNEYDADPTDRVINWRRTSSPKFAVIELGVSDAGSLSLDDFTDNGTILLTNPTTTPATRVLVDRWQTVRTFPSDGAGGPSDFFSYGPTLIGDAMPGVRLVGGFNEECLMVPGAAGATTFQAWTSPTAYLDEMVDERDGLIVGSNWGANPTFLGLGRSPGGTALPGEEQTLSSQARIEKGGNIVSDKVYWRKNLQTGEFGAAVPLPFSPTAVRSATLTEVHSDENGAPIKVSWNLVATSQGVLISKDGAPFAASTGPLAGVPCDGVTKQGWIADRENNRLWCNGDWRTLRQILGDDWTQADLLDILDNGLAVAKVKRAEQGSEEKIAFLLPLEIIVPRIDSSGNQINNEFVGASELKVAKWEDAFERTSSSGAVKDDFIAWDKDRFYIRIPAGSSLAIDKIEVATEDCSDSSYNDDPTSLQLVGTGYDWTSDSMILVSDDDDDDYSDSGAGADDLAGDRTHKVQLGGDFVIKSITISGNKYGVDVRFPVPIRKVLAIDFIRMDVDGVHTIPEINEAVRVTNERYAQVGLRVDALVKELPWPGSLAQNPGIFSLFELQPGDIVGPLSDDYKLFIDSTDSSGTNLFFLLHCCTAVQARGIAVTPRQLTREENPLQLKYIDKAFIQSSQTNGVLGYTPAHEILHLLAYRPEKVDDHNEEWWNLMNVQNLNQTPEVLWSKRIDVIQEELIYQHPSVTDSE